MKLFMRVREPRKRASLCYLVCRVHYQILFWPLKFCRVVPASYLCPRSKTDLKMRDLIKILLGWCLGLVVLIILHATGVTSRVPRPPAPTRAITETDTLPTLNFGSYNIHGL